MCLGDRFEYLLKLEYAQILYGNGEERLLLLDSVRARLLLQFHHHKAYGYLRLPEKVAKDILDSQYLLAVNLKKLMGAK